MQIKDFLDGDIESSIIFNLEEISLHKEGPTATIILLYSLPVVWFSLLDVGSYNFIALIHPIQWTIAYPVGADRPAKRQKKTSCVSTGQAGPVLCTRQVACSTSFLSRQRDVIASFSFGACLCARNNFIRSLSSVFIVIGENCALYL